MVNLQGFLFQSAYKFMTCLKPEHVHNTNLLEKLASLTNLNQADFTDRYGYLMSEK